MLFFDRLFKPKQPNERGFVNLDFEYTFPQVFWISGWGRDKEFPDGFRYKVLSLRHVPGGDFEVALIHETRDGRKTELQRWSVPPDKFDASDAMIQMLEQKFFVKFDRVDMSAVRTFEEFEARSREIGWEVMVDKPSN
jgi:hypothetical protein